MKIIELITFLSSGGAERLVVDLSNELAKSQEVNLVTILDDSKESENRNFYRSEVKNNVNYLNLRIKNGFSLTSQCKIYRQLKKLNPDIIHVHLIPTLKYAVLAIALLSLNRKVYFSVHNDLHNGYDRGIFKLITKTLGKFHKFRLSCLSNKNYNDFISYYPDVEIRCIENGRATIKPTNLYADVKKEMNIYRRNSSSRLLMHVARCHPDKNQKLLIAAVNSLVSDGENIDLIILGAGFDSELGQEILSMACDRIHYIGTRKNIGDYMLNADIFCLSSNFEGMPITLLEAGLAGVPTVSTPVCGSVDLIEDGFNGYLSKDHSLEEYKKTLKLAIDNFNSIKEGALNMKCRSPYTIEKCATKFIKYFEEG